MSSRRVLLLVTARGGGYEDYYTKAVRYGGKDVSASGFSPAASGMLEVVIANDGGQVEGTVVDEQQKPCDGALVVAVPAPEYRRQRDLYVFGTTDQNGKFTLRGIKPGEYKVFAWDSAEGTDYWNAEFLKVYEAVGQPLQVDRNSRASIVLKVISTIDE